MSRPVLLQNSWERGMMRDVSRDEMPRGSAWNLVDYIPHELGAPLRKRGGYSFVSDNVASTIATSARVDAVSYADFAAGAQLVGIDEDGVLFTVNPSNGDVTNIAAGRVPRQPPVMHRNKLIIPGSGAESVKVYTGSDPGATLADLGGSPPQAKYAALFKDWTILGGVTASPNNVYFSGAGDPESWDATDGWIGVSRPITGFAVLQNVIIVFAKDFCERIRGNVPPPNTDMIREPLYSVGCTDARSIVTVDDKAIWANQNGVFLSDGAALTDLTREGAISQYWKTLLSSYSSSSWTLAAGHFQGHYIISILNGGTFVDCLVCELDDRVWWRFANIEATSFAQASGIAGELYFGERNRARISSLSSCWNPSASVKNDADGDAVAPVLETPYFLIEPGEKSWKYIYARYMLEDAASDDPEITVAYISTPHATSYTNLTPTLDENTHLTRARVPLRFASEGLAFKFTQANESEETHLHSIEAIVHPREKGRL